MALTGRTHCNGGSKIVFQTFGQSALDFKKYSNNKKNSQHYKIKIRFACFLLKTKTTTAMETVQQQQPQSEQWTQYIQKWPQQ
jgi:hypothetical protein